MRRQAEHGGAEVVHWAGVKCAVHLPSVVAVLALLGAALLVGSCLNPRPEELPSAEDLPMSGLTPEPGNPGIGGDVLLPDTDQGVTPGDSNSGGQSLDPSPIGEDGPPSNLGTSADAGATPSFADGSDAGGDGG